MAITEKIEQIAFPIINKEFEERIPKGVDLITRATISGDMALIAEQVCSALESNPNLDVAKLTYKKLAIYFENNLN